MNNVGSMGDQRGKTQINNIQWSVSGQDAAGNFLAGATGGGFTTVLGVNGGSGSNAVTPFLVAKYGLYSQTTNAPHLLFTREFVGQTMLSSNRTASAITLTKPTTTAGTYRLGEDRLQPERFSTNILTPNVTNFDTNFPPGDYVFNVSNSVSSQQVTVNLPNYSPPNAPQISNYTAAHAIDPSQPFTLIHHQHDHARADVGHRTFRNPCSSGVANRCDRI